MTAFSMCDSSGREADAFRVFARSELARASSDLRTGGSVRSGSYPRAMTLGIVVFGAAFLVGLGLGTYTRRPLSTAFFVLGSFSALLALSTTGDASAAAAVLVIVFLLGLVADSVRETFALLVGR